MRDINSVTPALPGNQGFFKIRRQILESAPSTLANMEPLVADLKKQVQCFLCGDTFIEPKILSCFDVFCKPCIKRHVELIDEVNVFKCPRCNSQTTVPDPSSVENLEPSLIHSRILKGLALVEGEKVCSVSESHSTASWYCFDCDHALCQECEKSHSFFIKDHKVVRLAELKKEDIQFITTREIPCKSHPHQRMELFCEDCDDMICMTCWKHDHKDHKMMSLDMFASISKKTVLSKQLDILEQLRIDDEGKQKQEKIANIIKQQGEKAKNEVKDKTKKIIKMLQENERELLRQIEEKTETAATNLNIIHHIPAVKEYIENMMERGLASDMMNIRETQCSQKCIFDYFLPSSRIEFLPNQGLMGQVHSGLGEIRTCLKTDHRKSTIKVQSGTEALNNAKLVLTTKSSTGELNHDPRDVIDVHLKPEDNVNIQKQYMRNDGKVEVEFMAKVPGELRAEVRVNGSHVSNSPLFMNVKPHKMRILGQFNMKGVEVGTGGMGDIAANRDNSRVAVSQTSSHCVYVFTIDGDLVLTYGSQGSGHGQFSYPVGLAFLNDTDLVIADQGNHRICIVNITTGTLIKAFGNQGNRNGELSNPREVHVDDDDGNILVCDSGNHRVQVFTRDGDYQYQFGLTTTDKFDPYDVLTHDDLIYIGDFSNHVIHVFKKKACKVPSRILTIGGVGSADGQLNYPWGLAIDNDYHLLVCDSDNNRIQKFTLDGRFVGKTDSLTQLPTCITVLNDGQLLISGLFSSGVWCVK